MEFLAKTSLDVLGPAGIVVALLIYQNYGLRKDLKEERQYSKEINKLYRDLAIKATETMTGLTAVVAMLKDGLK